MIVAPRIETRQWLGTSEVGKVIAPFTILGLMINRAVFDLNFPNIKIALEVGHVVIGIP